MQDLIDDVKRHINEAEGRVVDASHKRDELTREVGSVELEIARESEQLQRLRRALEELGDPPPAAKPKPAAKRKASPKPPADPPRRRQTSSSRTPSPPAGSAPADRNRSAGEARRDSVLGYIRENPGCTGVEISKAVGLKQPTVSALTNGLARSMKIRRERDGRTKRHYSAETPITNEDELGARTQVERKVLDACLQGATVPGIEETTGIREAGSVAGGLVRIGALEREGSGRSAVYTTVKSAGGGPGVGDVEAAARAAAS